MPVTEVVPASLVAIDVSASMLRFGSMLGEIKSTSTLRAAVQRGGCVDKMKKHIDGACHLFTLAGHNVASTRQVALLRASSHDDNAYQNPFIRNTAPDVPRITRLMPLL